MSSSEESGEYFPRRNKRRMSEGGIEMTIYEGRIDLKKLINCVEAYRFAYEQAKKIMLEIEPELFTTKITDRVEIIQEVASILLALLVNQPD